MKRKNFKNYILVYITLNLLLIIIFFVSCIFSELNHNSFEFQIFNNISSFEVLNKYDTQPINEDIYLDKIIPIDYFCNTVIWQDNKYDVYAYIFADTSESQIYIKNRTKRTFTTEKAYFMTGNHFFSTDYAIYSSNRLMFISGPGTEDMYSFLEYLQQHFSNT